MLSEEALILAAVAGACVLLVLGVLELMWPTRRRRARRSRVEPSPSRPILTASLQRPAQSILPRRLIDSPSASRPTGGFVFPPPADYVPPPLPREEIRPIRPASPAAPEPVPVEALEVPSFLQPIEEPGPPPEPVYIAPPVEVTAPPVEAEPVPIEAAPTAVEPEATPVEPEPSHVEAAPHAVEAEPAPLETASPLVEPEPQPVEVAPAVSATVPPPVEPTPAALEPAPPEVEPEPEPPPIDRVPATFEQVAPPHEQVAPPAPAVPPPPPKRRRSKVSPHARAHRVLRPATPEGRGPEQSASSPAPPAPAETPAKAPLPTPSGPVETDTKVRRDSPLVERCFALYQEKRFDEVLTIGEEALARLRTEAIGGPSRETAALWSVVGLAKQALGDDDAAHAALESSIDAAPETERATYRRHLATLALDATQARIARAGSHDPADRMTVIRAAIAWTERGLAAVPSDPALTDARDAANDSLWQAYEQAATALLQRQEFAGARQILHEALDDPKLPATRAAGFRGLLSGTFGGEMGQLTAQAILSMQEGRESEALGTLQRAEELLETIPTDALPPTRRDEVDQRLWWGYAELGSRRLDAGDYEGALDPLVHALRFTSIGPERQAETRGAVVRALEGIAAVRALSIRRLAEAGSRDEAIVAAGELHGLVKRGLELGLSEDELIAAFARVRRLCEELGMDTRA